MSISIKINDMDAYIRIEGRLTPEQFETYKTVMSAIIKQNPDSLMYAPDEKAYLVLLQHDIPNYQNRLEKLRALIAQHTHLTVNIR